MHFTTVMFRKLMEVVTDATKMFFYNSVQLLYLNVNYNYQAQLCRANRGKKATWRISHTN